LRILCYRQKRIISLRIFGGNSTFHSAFLPKTHNSVSSLNTLYTDKSTNFYSAFLPTTISLTLHICRKRWAWLGFFTKNDPKTHSYKDKAKLHYAFSATMLSYATRLRRKTRSDRKFQISGQIWRQFLQMFFELCFVSINDWTMQKKGLKTDFANLVHVYL
jgi:hypothetical protein